jgi:biotin synthase-related radical SAM superfamily protein
MAKLTVEVVEIAEGAAEEEVLADLSERPLDPDRADRRAARSRNGERDRRARL